jgi:meso-butanediol dehydrogenase / (S,S)-butanediol dehydrogenase / diacetyl reductase
MLSADLSGTTALITGAGRGLGRGVGQALARQGARVACLDLDGKAAGETAALIREAGGQGWSAELDVTDERRVPVAVRDAASVMGGLDLAVCNAGVLSVAPVVELAAAEWRRVLDVNATGTFLVAQAAARTMLAAGTKGSIVTVASIAGKRADAGCAHYAASKFAVIGLTQALAMELAAYGITANAVCPGVVRTELMTAFAGQAGVDHFVQLQLVKRPQEPDEIAGAIAFLHRCRSVTGQAINVDGGTVFH